MLVEIDQDWQDIAYTFSETFTNVSEKCVNQETYLNWMLEILLIIYSYIEDIVFCFLQNVCNIFTIFTTNCVLLVVMIIIFVYFVQLLSAKIE